MNTNKGICKGGWPWVMAMGLAGALSACTSGDDTLLVDGASAVPEPTVVPAVPASTPPAVTEVTPLPYAAALAVNTGALSVAFNKPMDMGTLNPGSFTLECPVGVPMPGASVAYVAASQMATLSLPPGTLLPPLTTCTATVSTAAKDSMGLALAAPVAWQFSTGAGADTVAPTVVRTDIANGATQVAVNARVGATFSEDMNPMSVNNQTFSLMQGSTVVPGTTGYAGGGMVFVPTSALAAGTQFTATLRTGVSDLAGNAMASDLVWRFTTAATPVALPAIALNTAATYGGFGGGAGMTNTGTLSQVHGDLGTTATGTSMLTGFHDTAGDIYTETPANMAAVSGKIVSCTNATTGPTSAGVNAPACAAAQQALLDAQTAYLALVARPVGGASPAPGANLAGITLLAGTYVAPGGSFQIQGGDLTLDAQGDANAVWVFQMASTLTVGGPGAAFPQSIVLAGGALAKNVYWQVGSFATVNAAGGGTMVGTVISPAGASFSTVGNVDVGTLNGRVLSMGASVTLVNTVINVPQ